MRVFESIEQYYNGNFQTPDAGYRILPKSGCRLYTKYGLYAGSYGSCELKFLHLGTGCIILKLWVKTVWVKKHLSQGADYPRDAGYTLEIRQIASLCSAYTILVT